MLPTLRMQHILFADEEPFGGSAGTTRMASMLKLAFFVICILNFIEF